MSFGEATRVRARAAQVGSLPHRQCTIMELDTQLIDDGTYFVVTDGGVLAGCGGWSRRATLYGGDRSWRGSGSISRNTGERGSVGRR